MNCTSKTHNHNIELINVKENNECWKLVKEVTSDSQGKVIFEELICNQEYRLIETKASLNRLRPEGQWKIIVDSDKKINITAVGSKLPLAFIERDGTLLLPNMAMFSIPTSGNVGTEIFKVFGLVFILGGSCLLLIKKRKLKKIRKH